MLPLEGVRVVEFAHMVMGPSRGLGLADLGAQATKIAPRTSDNTRFPYARLDEENPRLIYCSLKGFLPGPYEHRPALDEVTQMMGGLAYMTGLPDRPLRAGSSVVDIMGGTFAAVAILAALRSRESTGRGMLVTSALFESTAYLVAQHMAQFEITGEAPPPMSVKRPAWGVYDIFETAGGGRLFIGVVTDTQWEAFCRDFGLVDLFEDSRLRTNGQRAKERAWLIPRLNELTRERSQEELAARLEAIGMPFAPIAKPWDLLDDPHQPL